MCKNFKNGLMRHGSADESESRTHVPILPDSPRRDPEDHRPSWSPGLTPAGPAAVMLPLVGLSLSPPPLSNIKLLLLSMSSALPAFPNTSFSEKSFEVRACFDNPRLIVTIRLPACGLWGPSCETRRVRCTPQTARTAAAKKWLVGLLVRRPRTPTRHGGAARLSMDCSAPFTRAMRRSRCACRSRVADGHH